MAGLVSQLVMPSRATPLRVPGQLSLDPVWTTGGLSDGVGPANIVVTDLTNDGHTDLLTCSNGYAYALNKVAGPAGYDTTWYSEYLGCSKVAAGDRDGDNVQEIYIGTDSGQVVIFAGIPSRPSAPSPRRAAVRSPTWAWPMLMRIARQSWWLYARTPRWFMTPKA